MNDFVYYVPTKVYFGQNQLSHLSTELAKFGKRVLLTYGSGSIKRSGLYEKIKNEIEQAGLTMFEFSGITPNPHIADVVAGAKLCRENNIDVVLAVGGGSTIDASKFIAASAVCDIDPWEFFCHQAPIEKALPLVVVSTMAATGSEMNGTGVLTNTETHEKIGRGSDLLRPAVSFLDPTVTYSVSKFQTACGSADILSHIMEVYFDSTQQLQMLDGVMEALMKNVIHYAPMAIQQPDYYEARANLMWDSSWAINGFIRANRPTAWSCHMMEHELSAYYDIAHGLGLAILTPHWMDYVLSPATVDKFCQFGREVFKLDSSLPPMELAKVSIASLRHFLFDQLQLPDNLTALNIDDTNFEAMATHAVRHGPVKGFTTLQTSDIVKIYQSCR